jgi:hypothetical protein
MSYKLRCDTANESGEADGLYYGKNLEVPTRWQQDPAYKLRKGSH